MESQTDTRELILEKASGVAVITLNRPRRYNAMTRKMMLEDIPAMMGELNQDREVKAIILTGAGDAFCSGADVGEIASGLLPKTDRTLLDRMDRSQRLMHTIVDAMKKVRQPIIGAINGMCAGGGFSLALLTDLRIASDRARFSMAFVRRGLIPDIGATYTLPRLVGTARAMEIMLLGDVFDAEQAEKVGIVNRVVSHQELMSTARELAERLVSGPTVSLELIKKGIYLGADGNLDQAAEFEGTAQAICRSTEDFQEGVQSFLEKREPHFQGQ